MRVHHDMPIVTSLKHHAFTIRRWSLNRLIRFGPRMTECAIPDGCTMTVLLEGFRAEPQVSLRIGQTSIPPLRCTQLRDEPSSSTWQAVFECPHPVPEDGQVLSLIQSGSQKVLPAEVREPASTSRPTRDAASENARWVQSSLATSRWRATRDFTDVRIAHVSSDAGTIRLSLTVLGAGRPSALKVADAAAPAFDYELTPDGDDSYRLDIAEFLSACDHETLPEHSTWRIWATGTGDSAQELRYSSRDLILPRDAIVYPTQTVRISDTSFVVRPYWSAVGTLRISVQRTEIAERQGVSL